MVRKKKRKSPSKRKKLIKQLDAMVRNIVRIRDKNCVTCGVHRKQATMNVSHKVTRRNYSTRWRLENCNLQCVRCHNEWGLGFTKPYNDYIDNTFGEGTSEALEIMGRKTAVEVGLKKDYQLEELLQKLTDEYNYYLGKEENKGWSWK